MCDKTLSSDFLSLPIPLLRHQVDLSPLDHTTAQTAKNLWKIEALPNMQTDGRLERFNKALKVMLRKLVSKEGKNWDVLLLGMVW